MRTLGRLAIIIGSFFKSVVIDFIQQLAAEKQATPAQIALALVLAQKPWIVPIPGTTRIERIQENNASAKITFTENELIQINEALNKIKIVGDRYPTHEEGKTGK